MICPWDTYCREVEGVKKLGSQGADCRGFHCLLTKLFSSLLSALTTRRRSLHLCVAMKQTGDGCLEDVQTTPHPLQWLGQARQVYIVRNPVILSLLKLSDWFLGCLLSQTWSFSLGVLTGSYFCLPASSPFFAPCITITFRCCNCLSAGAAAALEVVWLLKGSRSERTEQAPWWHHT